MRRLVPLALLAGFLGLVVAPGQSYAASTTHAVEMTCSTRAFDVDYSVPEQSFTVKVTAPASADNGATVPVTWTVDALPQSLPLPLTGASFTTTSSLEVVRPGFSESLLTDVTDPTDVGPLAPRAELPGGKSFSAPLVVTVSAPGDAITIHAAALRVDYVTADDGLEGAYVGCEPTDPDAVLATITVTNVSPDCELDDSCPTGQTFIGTPEPDALSLQAIDALPVQFPDSVTSAGTSTHTADAIEFARVTDTRSAALGWTLTAQLTTPMSTPGSADLPDTAVAVSALSCAPPVGATGAAPASAGDDDTLDQPVTLCAVAPGSLGSTGEPGGQWDVVGDLTLTVGAFQAAGAYSGTLTLVLS